MQLLSKKQKAHYCKFIYFSRFKTFGMLLYYETVLCNLICFGKRDTFLHILKPDDKATETLILTTTYIISVNKYTVMLINIFT